MNNKAHDFNTWHDGAVFNKSYEKVAFRATGSFRQTS